MVKGAGIFYMVSNHHEQVRSEGSSPPEADGVLTGQLVFAKGKNKLRIENR